jgi:hypothetical protein
MRILIAGATGAIGRPLVCWAAAERDRKVRIEGNANLLAALGEAQTASSSFPVFIFDEGFTRTHVDLEFAAAQLIPEMLAQRLLVDLQLLGDVGLSEAESRTSARWSAVGSYSAGISRSVSLKQGTRAREAGNSGFVYRSSRARPLFERHGTGNAS